MPGAAAFGPPDIPPTGIVHAGASISASWAIGRPGAASAVGRAKMPWASHRKPGAARKPAAPEIPDEPIAPGEPLPVDEAVPEEMELAPRDDAQADDVPREDVQHIPYAPGQKKPKKRRRFPFFGLLVLFILAGGAGTGAWFFIGQSLQSNVKAALAFDHIDYAADKFHAFELGQRQRIGTDDYLKRSQEIYENDLHGRSGDGFLYRQAGSEIDFADIVKDVKFEENRVVFRHDNSHDPKGDQKRFLAMLKALYAIDLQLRDDAKTNQAQLDLARTQLSTNDKLIADLQTSIADGQRKQAEFDLAAQKEKDVADQAARAEMVWNKAATLVHQLKNELDAMEASAVAAASAGGPPPSPADDIQIKQMSDRLKQLNDSLAAARGPGITPARPTDPDAPINGFQKAIDAARADAGNAPLADYLIVAQKVGDSIKQFDAELAARKRSNDQAIADLDRAAAEKIEAYLKNAWTADPDLKLLDQDLSVQQHRLEAATNAAGLTDEAAHISARSTRRVKKSPPAAMQSPRRPIIRPTSRRCRRWSPIRPNKCTAMKRGTHSASGNNTSCWPRPLPAPIR